MALLGTKLHIPTARRHVVPRPRLTASLPVGAGPLPRLVLVSAPAGFGKTTLMSQWLDQWRAGQHAEPRHVAWLSLDAQDSDPRRFLSHVIGAIQVTAPEVGRDAAALLLADSGTVGPGVLVNLINDLDSLDGSLVLAFDDYHVIESVEVHEAVTFLIDHLPDHLPLAIATRSDPPIPLARLRGRGQLTEVRAGDLRFTTAEAQEFLNRAMGLDLAEAEVEALEERTEGWVAGLQLAALSLRGIPEHGQVAAFIDAFRGSNRLVIDYLVDEVLARQSTPIREFLLSTAVLDRLTGPLCDAVTASADGASARMLEELERGNLFLVPLDTERSWYRYHHLFADVLRARLRAETPDRVGGLHRRAADWLAIEGLLEDAVRHALAAADFDRAAYLMEVALPELRRTRQDGVLLAWVRALPDSVVRRSPVLSILCGWSLLMSGDLDAVGRRLDDAETALAAGAHDHQLAAVWADTDDLRTAPATIAVYRASLAQACGDVAGTVRHAGRALNLAGPADHFIRGAAGGFLGLAAWAAGDVRMALSTFGEAVRCLHDAGNFVDELDGTIVLADLWVAAGRPSRARRLCEQALRTAAQGSRPYLRAPADLHVALAELDNQLDDLTSAEVQLETARAEAASITENRHRWFVARSQLQAARRDYDSATRLLDEAEALYRRGFYPDVRPISAIKARVQIAAGDLAAAADWADGRAVRVGDDPSYLREYEHLTLARLLIAQHHDEQHSDQARSTPLSAVLTLLHRLQVAATDAGREGSVQEIRMLQALAHHADGNLPAALAALSCALGEAPEPDSYLRLYLDEGAPMTALLTEAAKAPDPSAGAERGEAVRKRARRLLRRAQSARTTRPDASEQALVDPLSPRELEVLRLLGTELTGPEIARELYITLNTLRTHTKRIFTKLDARTRAVAVQHARERGLLSTSWLRSQRQSHQVVTPGHPVRS